MMSIITHIRDPAGDDPSPRQSLPFHSMPFEEKRKSLMDHPEQRHLAGLNSRRDTVSAIPSGPSSVTPPAADTTQVRNPEGGPIPPSPTFVTSVIPSTPSQWTPELLVKSNRTFNHVPRISALVSSAELLAKVHEHENSGLPLIIDGWHKRPEWNQELFSLESFVRDAPEIVDVRNSRTSVDVKMPLRELVQHYQAAIKEGLPHGNTTYYGKDIACPETWEGWLSKGLPSHFHPFADNDMFSHLPPKDRPENLMCYLGIENTSTPAHKDLCGSFGHNLMCHTTDGGSAFWFMSATGKLQEDEPAAYFHEKLGAELDLENHHATVKEFGDAPFYVYVAEQRLGDLVLVPPRSCHQVVNRGGITLKMSWSRMGLKSLEYSLSTELPLYHRVCRQETYRVKLTVFAAVKELTQRLTTLDPPATASSSLATPDSPDSPESRLPLSSCRDRSPSNQPTDPASPEALMVITSDLIKLLRFLDQILVEEWTPDHQALKHAAVTPDAPQDLHTCDFCGADIFQSFFACSGCATEDGASEFVCCPSCYVEGRSCVCGVASMEPRQSWAFDDLVAERNKAADALNIRLPPGKQIPQCNQNTLESSQHLYVFRASCMLRERVQRNANNVRKNAAHRCTPRQDEPAHDADPVHILQCRKCHYNMCFSHILELHGVHVAEALLVAARDDDHTTWHAMHSSKKVGKRRQLSLSEHRARERESREPLAQPLAKRMAWAATTFKECRPIDGKRAKEGFYDYSKQVEFVAPEVHKVGQIQSLPQTRQTPKNSARNVTVVADQPDSPLTELSELMDIDNVTPDETSPDEASDDDFVPPRAASSSAKKYTPAPAVRPVARLPRTPTVKRTAIAVTCIPIGITPRRRHIPYVLVPTVPRKRIPASDPVIPISPPKRIRVDPSPPTPASKRLKQPATVPRSTSASVADALNAATMQEVARFRQSVVVPIGSSPSSKAKSDQMVRRRSVQAQLRRPLDPPRVGVPSRPAKAKQRKTVVPRYLSSSRESSVTRPEPTLSIPSVPTSAQASGQSSTSGQTRQTSAQTQVQTTVVPANPPAEDPSTMARMLNILTELLQKERQTNADFQKRIEAGLAQESRLRIEVTTLTADSSSNRAIEMRAENAKLKKQLEESQNRHENDKRQEEQARQHIYELTQDVGRLKKKNEEYNRQIEALTQQVEQSQAAVADRDRNIGSLTQAAGLMLGSAINTVQLSQRGPVQLYGMQGVTASGSGADGMFQQGPWRPNGYSTWNARGRGMGKRFNGGVPHGTYRQYPNKGQREQGREFTSYNDRFNHPRGLPSNQDPNLPRTYDRNRGTTVSTDWHHSHHGGTTPTPPREKEITYERHSGRDIEPYRYDTQPERHNTDSRRHESQRERYEDDGVSVAPEHSLYGDNRRDDTGRSPRSNSPVSPRPSQRNGDGGWASFRHGDADSGPSNRPISPHRTEYSRSPSPHRRGMRDDREPTSREGSPGTESFLEDQRDHLRVNQSIADQDEEMQRDLRDNTQHEQPPIDHDEPDLSNNNPVSNTIPAAIPDLNPWAS